MTSPHIQKTEHVTPEEAEAVAEFAADVAGYLSLPRYRFNVSVDPAEEGAMASINTVQHRWVAEIYLCTDWMERSEEDRMNAVVHEVLHLLHRHVDRVVNEQLSPYIHAYEHRTILENYRREIELMIDHLAMFISDHTTVKNAWDNYHKKPTRKKK